MNRLSPLFLLLLAFLLPPTVAEAFDGRNPASVGVVVLPFETVRDEDESLGFALEDFLAANLERRLRRPVRVGTQVTPALESTGRACTQDSACVRLLGGQFNASLAALVVVRRSGETVTLDVAWFTTGNGMKVADETVSFASDRPKEMLAAFTTWVERMFDSSLRVTAESGAAEGDLLGDRGQEARRRDYDRGRRRTVTSRREDFSRGGPAQVSTRDDPTAGLRALIGEDDEDLAERDRTAATAPPAGAQRDATESTGSDAGSSPRATGQEIDVDLDSTPTGPNRKSPGQETGLDAQDTRGGALAGYNDAQRAGYSPRELKRFQRSGLAFPMYDERRWAFGKRFHLRVDFAYGLGGLTRRYSSLVHVRAGGVKTEEYGWESSGLSFVNPGGRIGFGVSPVDFFEFGVDVGVMFGMQALRREFIDQSDPNETIVSICTEADCPPEATWQTKNTTHVAVDFGIRFFIVPKGRVKPWAGIAGTLAIFEGYVIEEDGRYNHRGRPAAVAFGITPQGGVAISVSPFMAINIGVQGTWFAVQGETSYLDEEFFNGGTPELSGIPTETKEIPPRAEPWMLRAFVGPMILF